MDTRPPDIPATDNPAPDNPAPADQGAALVETHSAVVVFFGDHAYKVKKPVDLGFLDFSTIEARAEACAREVALNRRLAPDVYLGVSEIHGPDGSVCDHMVTMRRMPTEQRLRRCLERAEDVGPALRQVARAVAGLHASTPVGPSLEYVATRDAVRGHWTDGFEQLAPMLGTVLDRSTETRVEHLALRYLEGRSPLFEERIAGGQVRDGHGDLQAEDIFVLEDGPRILDCLEFDDELRWGDVLLDVGFLAMDLERLGHAGLARRLLADYQEFSGATWPASLAHHYLAYRAHVRAKVGAIRAIQSGTVSPEIEVLQQLCLDHLEQGRIRLVLVGGLPGTGKSTLSLALGDVVEGVVVRTDEVRRRLEDEHGSATDDPSGGPGTDGRYSPAAVDATYRAMLDEAERLLGLGEQVILDATWSDESHRDLARLVADRATADLVEIECVAPQAVCRARIERRLAAGTDPSEATPAVADAMAARFAPWPQATQVATDREPAAATDAARAVGGW